MKKTFIRIEPKCVLTPVIDYSRAEQNVHAIGVLHMGTRNYYRRIQRLIDKYPVGFYEGMVYYSKAYKDERLAEEHSSKDDAIYYFAKYAGLREQSLNYRNWKNVDIKLGDLYEQSKQSVVVFKNFNKIADNLDKIQKQEPEALSRVFKNMLIKAESKISALQYRRDAITRERDLLLYSALEKQLQKRTINMGIIYGAAHLYYLDTFLIKNDFEITKEKWVPAVEITENLSLREAKKRLNALAPEDFEKF
jgi:hypothetical protein